MSIQLNRVGFEIEYNGIGLEETANIIQSLYQGEVKRLSNNKYQVKDTKLGDFGVELDVDYIQKLDESRSEKDFISSAISENAENILGFIAPNEVVCPPIDEKNVCDLESLVVEMRNSGAKGTKDSILNAYGLHINASVEDISVEKIISVLKSFIKNYPYLKKEVDISRRITGFVKDYPQEYKNLVMDENYKPDIEEFARDYLRYNPTRNRALDLMPLLKYTCKNISFDNNKSEKDVKERPAFHYRLPDCDIDNHDWSLSKELEKWKKIAYGGELHE